MKISVGLDSIQNLFSFHEYVIFLNQTSEVCPLRKEMRNQKVQNQLFSY